jgi:hypothetical protein
MSNFVSYDLALLAKSKGFNEPCSAKINHRGELTHCEPGCTITNQFLYYSAAACTPEQLSSWLKDKKGIEVPPTIVELTETLNKL